MPLAEQCLFALSTILTESLREIVVFDIGAMPEGEPRYQRMIADTAVHVVAVEPNPIHQAALRMRNGDAYSFLDCVLGDGSPGTMHFTRYPGCTSLLEPDPAVIDLFSSIGTEDPFGNFQVMRREPVQTVRLDDLEGLRQPDLIKIDVQGAELTVLEHGTKTLARSLVVETEVEFLPLYKNQPLFGDVQVFMRDRGFVLHKLIDVAGRSLRPTRYRANPYAATSQLLWADAVFVRDFTNLKGYTDEDLAVAGAILHDVYRSFDLALFLLSELDRRRQSDMAARYIAAIQASPAEARERLYLNLKEFV